MKTHALIIRIDNDYTGSIVDVLEHINIPPTQSNRQKVLRCVKNHKEFNGHKIECVGVVKQKMLFGMYNIDDVLISAGTADELSKQFVVMCDAIHNAARTQYKLLGKYKVHRIGMTEIIEEITNDSK